MTKGHAGLGHHPSRARRVAASTIVSAMVLAATVAGCGADEAGDGADVADGAPTPTSAATPTPITDSDDDGAPRQELEDLRDDLFTTDLVVDAPESISGETSTFEVVVENVGPNPATGTVLHLGPGLSVVAGANCEPAGDGQRCVVGEILARESRVVGVEVLPGHPGTLTVSADHEGTDPTPFDARREVTVAR